MRAVVVERYGPPEQARIADLPIPTAGPDEVLVRIEAVAVTAGDARIRAGRFPHGFGVPARLAIGVRGPRRKVLGTSFSGVIEKVGAKVTGFGPGDEVAGMNGARMGAHAQYAAIRPKAMALKPHEVSHASAAGALFGGTTALHFLRDRVTSGSRVLVNGASGAVGTSAVQLAALLGAEVTAVTSARNQEPSPGSEHPRSSTTGPLPSAGSPGRSTWSSMPSAPSTEQRASHLRESVAP